MSSSIDDSDDEIFAAYQAKIDRLREAMKVWRFQYAPDFAGLLDYVYPRRYSFS